MNWNLLNMGCMFNMILRIKRKTFPFNHVNFTLHIDNFI